MTSEKSIFVISQHWHNAGCWNLSLCKKDMFITPLNVMFFDIAIGDTICHGIRSHGIDLVISEYSVCNTERVKKQMYDNW